MGQQVGPLAHEVDARWVMAYAAGLGETDSRYYDTTRAAGPAVHPVFPVCFEWPLALALRAKTMPEDVLRQGVHTTHDLTLHVPVRAGQTFLTTARIVGMARRRSGVLMTTRYETVDERGAPVATTLHASVYRDVTLEGPDREPPYPAGEPGIHSDAVLSPVSSVEVSPFLAHVYTECARIWNPIHTDGAVARAAGLPDIILHGTATLALAVSRVLSHAGIDPRQVRRVRCRFAGMVRLPSTFTVRASGIERTSVGFDAVDAAGAPVMREGALSL